MNNRNAELVLEKPPMSDSRQTLVSDGLLTVPEACRFLSLSRTSLYDLMDSGKLAYSKIGRSRRIPKRALVELAAEGLKGGLTAAKQ
jgi:excisionase family DNA binding protein